MSNGTSRRRRAMQLGSALIAVVGLVGSITAVATAQTQPIRFYSGVITGPDYCVNLSLGGPTTYPFDSDGDGISDICSLPRTRRATAARQGALELLALDFAPRFSQLYARHCTDVEETYGNPESESQDECAAPRAADAAGQPIPSVPASRLSPAQSSTWPSGFFSGPVVTSSTFCVNRSLGGPITYPLDTNGDGVADICSLPTTRRATIARQSALEELAAERDNLFSPLYRSECARLIDVSFGETAAEARDDCARFQSATGEPLPGSGGTGGSSGGSGGTGGDDTDTGGDDTGSQTPSGPTQSITSPSATAPGTYSKRAAQDVLLAPGNRSIVVSWDPASADDDLDDDDADPYDAADVFEYIVEYSTNRNMANARQEVLNFSAVPSNPNCGSQSASHSEFMCRLTNLINDQTYYVRILANRGLTNSTGSGNIANRDYWTPISSITPGIAGPPRWVDGDSATDGVQPLVSLAYGEITGYWAPPVEGNANIRNYTLQWGTNRSFANNCNFSNNCEQTTLARNATSHTITGLTNNLTYYARIQANTSNGPGTWSLTTSLRLTSNLRNPGQPTNVRLTTAAPGTSLRVAWDAPAINDNDPAATGYRVQWRNLTTNENWSPSNRQAAIASGSTLTHTIQGLNSLDDYQVRVLAINDRVAGPWSDPQRIKLGVAGSPFNIMLTPGPRSIIMNWTNSQSSPATESIVLQWHTSRSFPSNCSVDNPACGGTRTLTASTATQTLSNLRSNTVYYLRLRAINSNGPGDWSEVVAAEPGTLLPPTLAAPMESEENIRSVDLFWSIDDEAGKPDLTGFALRWRQVGTTSWRTDSSVTLAEAGCPQRNEDNTINPDYPYCPGTYLYTVRNLVAGATYEFQVLAKNSYGNGPWSASAQGIPGETFVAPDLEIVAIGGNIEIYWNYPSSSPIEPTRFTAQWRTCGTSGYSCGTWTSSRSTADASEFSLEYPGTRLVSGTYYQARVRVDGPSSTGGSGAWSESPKYLVTVDDNDTPNDRSDDTVTVTVLP